MSNTDNTVLLDYLDSSPTPFHATVNAAEALIDAGFEESQSLSHLPPLGFTAIDGSLIAWKRATSQTTSFTILGAHTDSPNIRLHPRPDDGAGSWGQLGVEIYGGVLLNSWLDRDLGLAGRVVLNDGSVRLFHSDEALARIPQLAIHLDRDVNERGLVLDKHSHLRPVWTTTAKTTFLEWLATETDVHPELIYSHDCHLYDVNPAQVIGADKSIIASGRIDNLVSCWAAVTALIAAETSPSHTLVIALHDHEEVGSNSSTGAAGPQLAHLLEALAISDGLSRVDYLEALSESMCLSMDNAHALHPNYPERHDSQHAPLLNHGPALKINNNVRYATTARGYAMARAIADTSAIPLQTFVSRNNIPCGSTIGPITATALGIETIDIGVPQLSMHSAREMCGALDPSLLARFAQAFLEADQ